MTRIDSPLLKVHVTRFWKSEDDLHFLVRLLDPRIELTWGDPPPDDYHVLVDGRPKPELLDGKPALRVVIIPWAGIFEKTRQLLLGYPQIAVHNLHHNAAATAEMALALLLSAAKGLIVTDKALRDNDWRYRSRPDLSLQLSGKTALIVGYGAIGQHLGRALSALGMRVLAIRRTPQPDEFAEIHPPGEIYELLPQANALLITAPLTPETRGMIGAGELSLLPQGAILVNVGRGALVDQKALFDALREGKLHAAGIDVWYNYPGSKDAAANTPPADYPFAELDNVVMSPHRGGSTLDADRDRSIQLAELLNAAARGEPIPNRVDVTRGY